MATPVASASQPAQLPALQGPHAGVAQEVTKKPKEKKNKNASASAYPLEVRVYVAHSCSWFNRPVL